MSDGNQFDVLASPTDDSKTYETTTRRGGKDDIKEQAFQAREQIKSKAVDLKEQVVGKITKAANQGLELAKSKAGLAGKDNEEIVEDLQDEAGEQWETVKRKTKAQQKKVEETVDENLTPEQKLKLKKGIKTVQKGAQQAQREAQGFSNSLINKTLGAPALRPVKNFIQKNNLQLPVVILGAILSLWMGLSIIRLITDASHPKVPEFDIHSKSASMDWLKYHAGEYKGKAVDMHESLTGRAAAFLANHKYENLKNSAVDYKEIGMKKLGLQEPTWGEYAWAKITGRPITWQERVDSVLSLAKDGINKVDVKGAINGGLYGKIKDALSPHEPTLSEKAQAYAHDIKARMPGQHPEPTLLDNVKDRLSEGIDSIKAKIPGTEAAREAAAAAQKAAYDATHPSTIDQIKSGANYIKNRVVHGSQEAAHIAQDRANELADKAKYKAGL